MQDGLRPRDDAGKYRGRGALMSKRKSLSLKTRFDIFKRDDFTCRYCGRKTPEVVLQVDHVIPVAEGGDNDVENLVTSCFECNSGKGAGLLDNLPNEIDIESKALLMAEKERQLREYNFIRLQVKDREDEDIDACLDYWYSMVSNSRYSPNASVLRRWLRRISKYDVMEAMEIAFDRKPYTDTLPYFLAVLKNKYGEERIAP